MFTNCLEPGQRILDVGSGGGLVCRILRQKGFEVIPIDIADLSYSPSEKPMIFDGEKIPFPDQHFDMALLLSVLHHIEDPESVLAETARVSKNIIVLEDIFQNPVQKYFTFFADRMVNMGFAPCPHTNKSDKAWKKVFKEMGMKLKFCSFHRVLIFFRQAVYHLESGQIKNS